MINVSDGDGKMLVYLQQTLKNWHTVLESSKTEILLYLESHA
jgi:hypothetical protein